MKTKLQFFQTERKARGLFGNEFVKAINHTAIKNEFAYTYVTDPKNSNYVLSAAIRTPDGMLMLFATASKFCQDAQMIELWFNSHANGVAQAKEQTTE